MADTTSIIEIDVRSEAFKEFNALFKKYQKEVASLPGAWGRTEKAIKSSANPISKIVAILKDGKDELAKATKFADKLRIAGIGTAKVFSTITKSSASLAKNIASITLNIAKWAALGLFTLAAGGFGLDKLAQSASNQKREAGALGITTGQRQSAQVNFGRFGDPDAIMQKILEAQTDPSKRYTLIANGINNNDINTKNPAEILKQLLPNLAKNFAMAPKGSETQFMHARGMDQFGDLGYMKNVLASSITGELAKLIKRSKVDDKQLNSVSTKTATAWQDFLSQLDRAGDIIENLLKNHLVPLSKPLGDLYMSFTKALDTIFKSGKPDKWIKEAGKNIEGLAKDISEGKYDDTLKNFMEGVDKTITYIEAFGDAIKTVLQFLGVWKEPEAKLLSQKEQDQRAAEFWKKQPDSSSKQWFFKNHPDMVDEVKKSYTPQNVKDAATGGKQGSINTNNNYYQRGGNSQSDTIRLEINDLAGGNAFRLMNGAGQLPV